MDGPSKICNFKVSLQAQVNYKCSQYPIIIVLFDIFIKQRGGSITSSDPLVFIMAPHRTTSEKDKKRNKYFS